MQPYDPELQRRALLMALARARGQQQQPQMVRPQMFSGAEGPLDPAGRLVGLTGGALAAAGLTSPEAIQQEALRRSLAQSGGKIGLYGPLVADAYAEHGLTPPPRRSQPRGEFARPQYIQQGPQPPSPSSGPAAVPPHRGQNATLQDILASLYPQGLYEKTAGRAQRRGDDISRGA